MHKSAQNVSLFDQVEKGIEPPSDLVTACNLLGEVKNFQDECVQVVAITVYSLKFPSGKNSSPASFLCLIIDCNKSIAESQSFGRCQRIC